MSRWDFTSDEFGHRREQLCAAMERAGWDWLIVTNPRSILWLTGCRAKSYQAFQCVLFPKGGATPVFLTRYSEKLEVEAETESAEIVTWGGPGESDPIARLADLTKSLGVTGKQVAVELPPFNLWAKHWDALRATLGPALADASDILDKLRLIKSAQEQAHIRRAAAIADKSIAALQGALEVGQTELALAGHIYQSAMSDGADVPASIINLSSGPRAIFSHGAPSEHRIMPGEHGNAEYGVPYRGYPVSIGRQFTIGPPAAIVRDTHAAIAEALEAAINVCRDGVRACDVFDAANEVLERAGLSQQRVHTMGYAVSTAFPPATGEAFHITPENTAPLQAGMQISLCPNVFSAEREIGVRLVDNILVEQSGASILTCAPREIIEGRM